MCIQSEETAARVKNIVFSNQFGISGLLQTFILFHVLFFGCLFHFKTSLQVLQSFRRVQHCSLAVKLQKCFMKLLLTFHHRNGTE